MTISPERVSAVEEALAPLIGIQLELLRIPKAVLVGFEPSQVGTIVGTLMDASLPQLELILPGDDLVSAVGLKKAPGLLGDREGYPDYVHESGVRLELKLLYLQPEGNVMKEVATAREPSARLTQKVTVKNVDVERDLLMLLAYQLRPTVGEPDVYAPTIVDIGLFPTELCIAARDQRLVAADGRWFGDFETPAILSRAGRLKLASGQPLDTSSYGRKESEQKDFNEDTNFGKLKRIPYRPLQEFLRRHGCSHASSGLYPAPWSFKDSSATTVHDLALGE